jgi:hypothetical protein
MSTITTTIDIACPPSLARTKFLDFASLPKYHTTHFSSITPLGPLEPGQQVRVQFAKGGLTMTAPIQVRYQSEDSGLINPERAFRNAMNFD